ncbi:MAG: DUF5060 domain-containing protein [Gammaproteobacteria bacterium]|nr:DUF5060 domain-containing protein [Gammaproteobacteria bacterium]
MNKVHKAPILSIGIVSLALTMAGRADCAVPTKLFVTALRSTDSLLCYELFELSFKHNGAYDSNFFDVALDVVYASPSGTQRRVKGFYYGGDRWKARFRPDEPGTWTYISTLTGKGGFRQQASGTFNCTTSNAEGPVRRHPNNPYRWVFANGKPYFPVGLQECVGNHGARLTNSTIDGEGRSDTGRRISWEEYFSIYAQAGFNLYRFSQKNCSYMLYDDLDRYREDESKATDELLSLAREQGFRVMFGFFGYHGDWMHESEFLRRVTRKVQKLLAMREEAISALDDHKTLAKEKRFIEYAVARWGVYVDFWELLNEREASDEWTSVIAGHVRSVDPDRKPISTSWEKPHLPAIDINAPHWYESESEFESDLRVQQQAAEWKQAGKPVIVGEQGNTGMNWDPLSGVRMRIRTWSALFQEISFIFWNTSWSKAGMFGGRYNTSRHAANIYLGPEERGYIRVLQDFSSRLDAGMHMFPVDSSRDLVRAYGLLSSRVATAYLHHFKDHTTAMRGVKITLRLPGAKRSTAELDGEWIDPSSGNVLGRVKLPPGRQTLDVPPFPVDLALLITLQRDNSNG